MEVLTKTQFSDTITPKFQKLPPFLTKKLEEAVIKAHMKKHNNVDTAKEKLEKAERKRQEKLDEKMAKLVERKQWIENAQVRVENAKATKIELHSQIYEYKHSQVDQRVKEQISQKVMRGRIMGTIKVEQA